ncbi:hypothetical protein Ccrd_004913, partial [Cynara cardunculus var. scolymus]
MKKAHAKDKSALSKFNKGVQESRRAEKSINTSDSSRHSSDYYDAIKAFPKPRQASSDEEESARNSASSASAPLSILIVPSLKEAVSDDLEASVVRSVINSLMDMEYTKPGSCKFLVTRLLHRLASSKEPALKDLQEVATRGFSKGKTVTESEIANAEADAKKKQQNKEAQSHANLSPLARFLLSSQNIVGYLGLGYELDGPDNTTDSKNPLLTAAATETEGGSAVAESESAAVVAAAVDEIRWRSE